MAGDPFASNYLPAPLDFLQGMRIWRFENQQPYDSGSVPRPCGLNHRGAGMTLTTGCIRVTMSGHERLLSVTVVQLCPKKQHVEISSSSSNFLGKGAQLPKVHESFNLSSTNPILCCGFTKGA